MKRLTLAAFLFLATTFGLGCATLQSLQPRAVCLAELARPETALKLDAGQAATKRAVEAARAGKVPDERDLATMKEAARLLETTGKCLR